VVVAVACAAGCVDVSFNYDTVVSTSSNLDWTALIFASISFSLAGASFFAGAAFYRVILVLPGSICLS
jgi:NADH:ubiquinone oxidoreductase subunit 6 (subunit J)